MNKSIISSLSLESASKGTKKQPYRKPEAVKFLEKLAFDAKLRKHPTIPIGYLVAEKYRDDNANGLTKCIVDFIRIKGFQAERISTTGRPIDRTKTFIDVTGNVRTIGRIEWIKGTTANGSADISATINGRSVKIEVKVGRDRMSEAQKDYRQSVESAGGVYYIAMDFTSFYYWYNVTFKP